jgi:predicted transcriptional regulator
MPTPSTTSLKLDPKTKERVQRLASARRRSSHWVMREAIEQYMEREEKREQFRQDALAAWTHYQTTGRHAAAEEAEAWLTKLEGVRTPLPLNATTEMVPTGPAGCGPSPRVSSS